MHLSSQHRAEGRQASAVRFARASRSFVCLAALMVTSLVANLRGQGVETIRDTELFEPYGISVGADGLYYVTDSANNRVVVINPSTGGLTNLVGKAGVGGQGAENGSGEQARLYSPQGVAHIDGRRMVVADSGNNVLRLIDENGFVTNIVGDLRSPRLSHELQLPMDNAGTNDGPGLTAARLNAPVSIAYESGSNTILVADMLNGRIRRVALTAPYTVSTLLGTNGQVATFARPTAVAVSSGGRIFVADSQNHAIYELIEGANPIRIAGSGNAFSSGMVDSQNARLALFRGPRGIYVDEPRNQILVSDSGNGILRRITGLTNATQGVLTIDGTLGVGILNPIGITRDRENVIVFADLDGNAIKAFRETQAQPQIVAPVFGQLITNTTFCGNFSPFTNAAFNNEPLIVVDTEDNTVTRFTFGPAGTDVPDPGTEFGTDVPPYEDCMTTTPRNLLDSIPLSQRSPSMVLKAISTAANRRPSPVTTVSVDFKAAKPVILGADSTSLTLETITRDAEIYYTVAYGTNTPDLPSPGAPGTLRFSGTPINIFVDGQTAKIRVIAVKGNYHNSDPASAEFPSSTAKRSRLVTPRVVHAGSGATVMIPMNLMPEGNVLRTLQYRVDLGRGDGNAQPLPSISLKRSSGQDFIPNTFGGANLVQSLQTANGIAITLLQTEADIVITNEVMLGVLAVKMPAVPQGTIYTLKIQKPTGTSDGIDKPVAFQESEMTTLMVTNRAYIVGDVAPALWYNVGDFGTGDSAQPLENNDVLLAFRAALGIAVPYVDSDVFDAMDSFPLDRADAPGGDGQIRFLDWQTTLQRSLGIDPDPTVWKRSRNAAGEIVVTDGPAPGTVRASTADVLPAAKKSPIPQVVWTREALLNAQSLDGDGIIQGNSVSVPVSLTVRPGSQVAGMQFTATVYAQGANPPFNSPVAFVTAAGIPRASLSAPGNGSISCAWNIGSFNPPLTGSNLIGYLQFQIPLTEVTGSGYLIQFTAADGSPDLNTQYTFETSSGVVTVHAPAGSPDDSISDEWKRNFFGSEAAANAAANLDPDGDGASNACEFRDGTSPILNNLQLQVSHANGAGNKWTLQWFGASGVKYAVEALADLQTKAWSPVAAGGIPGQGGMLSYEHQSPVSYQFYRVRIVP